MEIVRERWAHVWSDGERGYFTGIQYVFEVRKFYPDKKTIKGEIFRGVAQILVRRLAIACKVSPSSNLGSAPHGGSSC
jgi:hypothetical protein